MSLVLFFLIWFSFLFISWRQLIWGIGFIIIFLPSYLWRFNFFGLPTTFLEILILSLLLIWLLKDKRYQRINWRFQARVENPIPKLARYWLTAWLLVSILAVAYNPTLAALGLWRAYFLEPMFFFVILMYAIKSKQDLKIIIWSLGFLLWGLFLVAVFQNLSGWNLPAAYDLPNVRRLTTIFPYPNALSLLTAPLAAFFAGLYLVIKKNNYFYLLIFALGFLLSWWAVSQGALVGIIAAVAIYCLALLAKFLRIKIKKNWPWLFALVLLILLVGAWFTGPVSSLRQQVFHPRLDIYASSLEIRSSQWSETWQMLKNNWWSGAGLGGYQTKMINYHQVAWLELYLYPHNIFLNFWSELGLLGLLVFLAFIYYLAYLIKKLFIQGSFWAWPLTMFWVTWFVHGLVDVPYFKNDLSLLFFLALAITISVADGKKQFTV